MEIKSAFVALGLLMLSCAAALAQDRTSANAPQYGQWGFDATGRDDAVKPGDDFFRHINGAWLDRTEIPADKPAYTLRLRMTDTIEARLHDLMEQAAAKAGHQPADLEGKIGAYYRAYMDEARVEQLGAAPLKPLLEAVLAAKRRSQLSALMGRNNSSFNGTFFSLSIDADLKNPKIYSVYINQAGLGLPDRDYYLKPEFAAQKEQYKAYIARLLTLVGWPSPDARAADIVGVETAIANASWTKVQQRDPVAEYNPMTVDQLQAVTPDFDWHAFLASAGLSGVTRVVVGEKSAVPKIAHIFRRVPVPVLQAWQAFTIADNAAPFLSKSFNDAYFEMRKKTLSGQPEQEVRWKRAVHAVAGGDYGAGDRFDRFGSIGFGTGELYSAKYFPPAAKEKIEALVANLKAAYRLRLQKLDWMGPATKEEALRKLDTYTIKVGYPDHPRDYSQLVIRDDGLLGDAERAGAIDWQFYVERLNQPVDRSDWSMTPQTNDAYNGSLRDIVFPAGILQPPIFDPNADAAINYGAAGGIIGHELTHGFDDEGRKIDAEGKLRDWWQPADAKQFEARAKQLGAQYSGFEPLPGVDVNGDLTMGENIADLGGLTLALGAYRALLHGQPAPVLDGLTGEQRVFIGWAQAWRGKVRDDYVKKQVVSDPHAPRQFRVNGVVRNIDAWYGDFAVQPGEKLYVAPKDRVRIW